MRNKTCFMFGHATAPEETVSLIEAAAEKHYHKYGIHTQAIKKVPFLMGRADPLKSCGISRRGSERGSVFSRYAL